MESKKLKEIIQHILPSNNQKPLSKEIILEIAQEKGLDLDKKESIIELIKNFNEIVREEGLWDEDINNIFNIDGFRNNIFNCFLLDNVYIREQYEILTDQAIKANIDKRNEEWLSLVTHISKNLIKRLNFQRRQGWYTYINEETGFCIFLENADDFTSEVRIQHSSIIWDKNYTNIKNFWDMQRACYLNKNTFIDTKQQS